MKRRLFSHLKNFRENKLLRSLIRCWRNSIIKSSYLITYKTLRSCNSTCIFSLLLTSTEKLADYWGKVLRINYRAKSKAPDWVPQLVETGIGNGELTLVKDITLGSLTESTCPFLACAFACVEVNDISNTSKIVFGILISLDEKQLHYSSA
ncbi:hypothetical protein PAPH110629_20485 [Paenibacillus phoenicis]